MHSNEKKSIFLPYISPKLREDKLILVLFLVTSAFLLNFYEAVLAGGESYHFESRDDFCVIFLIQNSRKGCNKENQILERIILRYC